MAFKFFDKYYVGIQNRTENWDYWDWRKWRESEPENVALGFATPYEDNAAGRKRMETVDAWAKRRSYHTDKETSPQFEYFDNVPVEGFTVLKSVSRYSTSNVFFRIMDPRGFQLEIAADNLMHLLTKCTIIEGVIESPLVWARAGTQNYLVRGDDPRYIEHITPKEDYKPMINDFVEDVDGNVYLNLGRMYATFIEGHCEYGKYEYQKSPGSYYGQRFRGPNIYSATHKFDPKLWSVYLQVVPNHMLERKNQGDYWSQSHGKVHLRRTPMKNLKRADRQPTVPLKPFVENEFVDFLAHDSTYWKQVALTYDKAVRPKIPSDNEILYRTGAVKI